jgi:phage repressor protein C with HTH and peptisase S24 domain
MAQGKLSMIESTSFASMRAMQTLGARIKHVREIVMNDLSQAAFAEQIGVTRGALGNWERDKGIKRENIVAIAEKSGVSLDWLLHGVGPTPKPRHESLVGSDGEPRNVANIGIKEFDCFAGLGGGQMPDGSYRRSINGMSPSDSFKEETWVFPSTFVERGFRSPANKVIAVAAKGESMAPTINHGDVVFIDTNHRRVSPPGLYALRDIYGEIIIKRVDVFRSSDDYTVRITSDNPHEPSRDEPLSEVDIVGRVCGMLKIV